MPITRKALAVANKVLEFMDQLPEQEREDVIMILMDTFREQKPQVDDIPHLPTEDLAEIADRIFRDPPHKTHQENGTDSKPQKPTRVRRFSPHWKKAKPEVIEQVYKLPKKVTLTKAQQRALRRNLLAIMEERDLSNYKISSLARKAGYQVSHGTVGNMVAMKYDNYTQMTLQAVAAATKISLNELLKPHA